MAAFLERCCNALIAAEADLNALDAKSGDGDTGSTLASAARALVEARDRLPLADATQLYRAIGLELSQTMGGSSGVLLAIFFAAAGASSFLALRQTDLKQALAYTTLMALGASVMFLGAAVPIGVTAAVTFVVAHGDLGRVPRVEQVHQRAVHRQRPVHLDRGPVRLREVDPRPHPRRVPSACARQRFSRTRGGVDAALGRAPALCRHRGGGDCNGGSRARRRLEGVAPPSAGARRRADAMVHVLGLAFAAVGAPSYFGTSNAHQQRRSGKLGRPEGPKRGRKYGCRPCLSKVKHLAGFA